MGKPRPRNVKPPSAAKPAAGSAGKLHKFKKPKGGEDHPKEKSRRSVWGLVGLAVGLASLLAYFTGAQRKEKRRRDRRILDGMLRRPLGYSEHALCRMECRFVSKPEVVQLLQEGSVNDRKSRPQLRPCPKYVVDGRVGPQGKNVQGVFSACTDATNVVTVIDRDTNWACPPC